MTRFFGKVGYGIPTQVAPGRWEDVITDRTYSGDVSKISRQQRESADTSNFDMSVSNVISIVADAFAMENFVKIVYVKWAGRLWTVIDVTVEAPRLILRIGEVYNGPQAPAS